MKIIKKVLVCASILASITSNAQNGTKEDGSIKGRELFNRMDQNADGKILISETKTYYANMLDWRNKPVRHKLRFDAYDRNEDSVVTLDEIILGLDWDAYSKRKGVARPKKVIKTPNKPQITRSVVKKTSGHDVIDEIENSTVTIADVESTLQKNTSNNDNLLVDEEMSLEDFKNKFINKRNRGQQTVAKTTTRVKTKVSNSNLPKFMLTGTKITKGQAVTKLQKIDSNYDGYADLKEMQKFYKGKSTPWGNKISPFAWFIGYDRDENKKIDASEFERGVDWKLYQARQNK